MRTSRISRDTSRVVDALSASQSNRRSSRLNKVKDEHETSLATPDHRSSDSELSSPPASPAWNQNSSLGKRKRTPNHTRTKEPHLQIEATPTRRSSGKAHDTVAGNGVSRSAPRKANRRPAKRINGPNGELKVEAPPSWATVYEVTARMRKRVLAPVDTMGCESLAEADRSPKDQRLQTLISLMLSSQTKDTVTAAAMRNLQQNMPGGFCLDSLMRISESDLNKLIEKVGFHNTKAKHIKKTAAILQETFESDIPDSIEGLISLPGVGPKMAYLCMSAAWGRDEGIGVDVHVHRITNLWRWHKTSTPEQTRESLQSWLPKDKWHDINHLLVGLGQTICLPVGRKCGECDLATQGLCPSAVTKSPVKKRVKKETVLESRNGHVVKAEEIKVESDDVAVKVEAEIDGQGAFETSAVADIEDT
ncbi:DNA glycosylase [Polychaeton citri CBS 116435]|uniref:Endonuclease III homolog n=1 Tax=Polychaeton citri CBS 116435 TaxID=1314669 RepID=A0A9P4QJ48_9PEZI|nr:DNA glycosylase [Polychaeton citri CBS 116435]